MQKLPLPSLIDGIRLLRSTEEEAAFAYREWLKAKDDINFSYGPALRTVRPIYSGIELSCALEAANRCPKTWKKANEDVIRLVHAEAEKKKDENGKPLTCLETPYRRFVIRPDMKFSIRPSVLYVLRKKAIVLWVQPRKTHGMNFTQIGILMAIAKHAVISDDIPDSQADIEFLDLSADDSGSRLVTPYRLEDFTLPNVSDIQDQFQIFARAYDEVCREGFEIRKRPRKRPDSHMPNFL
ncbi:hypothetical protein [Azospirillum rugosum]|uniref:Uncharacterized protein n=1 Tax=Azospirillum rugosum TaxID=416170 RepID=A0ABS4SSG1_9PROT|nr:hypothetical protein [Azospirillum rugosum]MBP2295174.1 hypothetical protein [Azospirillum rugosum]MDQ0528548.1 hypothetical protein [Azospirillum rugosum]